MIFILIMIKLIKIIIYKNLWVNENIAFLTVLIHILLFVLSLKHY